MSMKNISKQSRWMLAIVLLLMSVSSCKDDEFFEQTNPPETPWLNVNEFERAVIGAYAALLTDYWGAPISSHNFVKIIGSDVTYWIPGEGGNMDSDAMYYRKTNQETGYASGFFSTSYSVINNVNVALDFIAQHNGDPFPNASQADKEHNLPRIEGELLFLRAVTYRSLAAIHLPWYKTEGGNDARILPLRTTFPSTGEEAASSKIGTVEEIWQQIVADLTKAKELLPETYMAGVHHPTYQHGRANKFAAAAMLARVHFQMGNWDEAMKELNFVIDQNGGQYDLSEDPIDAWNKDSPIRGREVIWYQLFSDPNDGGRNYLHYASINKSHYEAMGGGGPISTGGNNSVAPWNGFTWSYDALARVGWMVDPKNGDYTETEEAKRDKRYQQLYYRYEGYKGPLTPEEEALGIWEARFEDVTTPMVWANKYYRGNVGIETNVPLLRLAEMYLTRAIIRHRQGDVAGATADVNVVRVRAGLDPLSSVTEEDIHNERIKEMHQEGDRLDYLRALHLPIPPGDRDPSQPFSTIEYPYTEYAWSIPQREKDLNAGYTGL
ncbi:RagB/SusD family nutrient uptake outer membrane protein [Pontibacter korlensis]|uniref:Carbohydrate-binding protein SusD n=2 Tax=Pontibacter korlensis TaxID=400092 RepID=A0A0E3ZFW1_9BACT|nr:hypothetical protein PKOR_12385 [Pontibacter korlensis]